MSATLRNRRIDNLGVEDDRGGELVPIEGINGARALGLLVRCVAIRPPMCRDRQALNDALDSATARRGQGGVRCIS